MATADHPSRPRNDGQRGQRGRGRGRGRGGASGDAGGESRHPENRGGRRGRGGSRGGSSSQETANANTNTMNSADLTAKFATQKKSPKTDETKNADEEPVEAEVCFICASDVEHNAVAPCNHRTCHICALRMRALYKTKDCVHCRVGFAPISSIRLG